MNKFPIVGMRHHKPADLVVTLLSIETPLRLEREPHNAYDPNAVAVYIDNFKATNEADVEDVLEHCGQSEIEWDSEGSTMLGYIPKGLAAELAPLLDKELADGKPLPPARYTTQDSRPALEIGTWADPECTVPDFTEPQPAEPEPSEEEVLAAEGTGPNEVLDESRFD